MTLVPFHSAVQGKSSYTEQTCIRFAWHSKVVLLILLFSSALSEGLRAQSFVEHSSFDKCSSDKDDTESRPWGEVTNCAIYGGGSLFSLASGNDLDPDDAGNAAPMGSLGISLTSHYFLFDFYLSKAGEQELDVNTLDQFGSILMNPNISGDGVSANLYFLASRRHRLGLHGEFRTQNARWNLDSLNSVSAAPLRLRLGVFYRPWCFDKADQKMNFEINAHYTHRSILGNFGNASRMIGETLIDPQGFNGFDLAAVFRINGLELFVQYSTNTTDLNIPGFTGAQFTYGLNVTGAMIKLIDSEKADDT